MTTTYLSADWVIPMAGSEFAIADGAVDGIVEIAGRAGQQQAPRRR